MKNTWTKPKEVGVRVGGGDGWGRGYGGVKMETNVFSSIVVHNNKKSKGETLGKK